MKTYSGLSFFTAYLNRNKNLQQTLRLNSVNIYETGFAIYRLILVLTYSRYAIHILTTIYHHNLFHYIILVRNLVATVKCLRFWQSVNKSLEIEQGNWIQHELKGIVYTWLIFSQFAQEE